MLKCEKGVSLIITVMVMLVVVVVGTSMVAIVVRERKSIAQSSTYQTAASLAQLGMMRSLQPLKNDMDWSDNGGVLYDNVAYMGGTYTVDLSNPAIYSIKITSTGKYKETNHTLVHTLTRTSASDAAFYLQISTADAEIDDDEFKDIKLTNLSPTYNVRIEKMIVSWYPDNDDIRFEEIRIDDDKFWEEDDGTPLGEQPIGTLVWEHPFDLNVGMSDIAVKVEFDDDDIEDVTSISLFFLLSDGSTAHVEMLF